MYLGIDIGTSTVKAVLTRDGGEVVLSATAPLQVSRPQDGWSEQDPDAWITAVEAAVGRLQHSQAGALAAVRGIGLSGQMHGATLLDDADRPLRPAILWNDGRAARQAAELDADPRFRAISGSIVYPGFTAPKLVWVARHEPEVFAAVRRVLLPKDYVRLWLSGEHVSDPSDAAGTAWLDIAARNWSGELLEATGMKKGQMPRLCEGTEVSGTLRGELANRWGMGQQVCIAGGAGDNAASACGIGAVLPGSAFVSLGTSGVLFATTDQFRPGAASAVHAFCHALPQTWHQMAVILSAGGAFDWFSRLAGRSASDVLSSQGTELVPPSRVRFLPYLAGERTPHNGAAARGAFVGLDLETDLAQLARAVLEGVAFGLRDCANALAAAGTKLSRLTAVGGGARSRYWLRLIATILGIPVDRPAEGEFGAAVRAARLGQIAATGADPAEICRPPAIAETLEPAQGLVGAYREAHANWQMLYPAIKGAHT